MCAEYILSGRDPRRNQPLVDFLTSLKIDEESTEAFNVSKQQDRASPSLSPFLPPSLFSLPPDARPSPSQSSAPP